ncbi:MAG TPA: IS66 family insertion sequence element accessory protein TnpB [Anaerovoracaceae bacterium]|nr:IS66 family insertion sequence element accessory protein TnpB [Anaerovoracaceae bacterium]
MLDVRSIEKVHISCRKSDMRKSINGLAVIVQESFQLDPFENAIFLFYNGDKTRANIGALPDTKCNIISYTSVSGNAPPR